ncbi:MAG: hypothetical protein JRJ39_00050 [Deltaproteobacteria bacterium]|nr:hypothetical protein [Deltaproteobacteria bacterium]
MLDIRMEIRINKYHQKLLKDARKKRQRNQLRDISYGSLARYAIEQTFDPKRWEKDLGND